MLSLDADSAVLSRLASSDSAPLLSLESVPGELAYAIYQFILPEDAENIAGLIFTVTDLQSEESVPMAIANFNASRWEHLTLSPAGIEQQELSDFTQRPASDYSNMDRSCFVALIAYDGFTLTLAQVQLLTGTLLLPPENLVTNGFGPQETFAKSIDLSWDPVVGADGYEVFGRRILDGPGDPFILLASIDGGENTSFSHTDTDPPLNPCPYNELMEYKVRSRAGAEVSAIFSPVASGLRTVRPPAQLIATDQTNTTFIRLRWTAEPEAVEYRVNRNFSTGDEIYLGPDLSASCALIDDPGRYPFFVTSVSDEGPGFYATKSDANAGTIEWRTQDFASEPDDGRRLFDAAVVAGRPALIYRAEGELRYSRAAIDEPDSTDDWVTSRIAVAVGAPGARLVEHQGKPWVIFADASSLPRMAHASVALPAENSHWSSYPMPGAEVDDEGFAIADVNHLLKVLVPDPPGVGGSLLILSATIEEPQEAGVWNGNLIDESIVNSNCFDIREIGEGTALLLENDDDLVYMHTGVVHPEPADWTTMVLPKAADQGSVQFAELAPAPLGRPSGVYQYRISLASHSGYVHSTVASPQQEADWVLTTEPFPASLGASCTLGYFNGLPLVPRTTANQVLAVHTGLAFPPDSVEAGWDYYELVHETDLLSVSGPLCLLDFGGRPALVYQKEDAGEDVDYISYSRVQPKS